MANPSESRFYEFSIFPGGLPVNGVDAVQAAAADLEHDRYSVPKKTETRLPR